MVDVGIVILNYKMRKLVEPCLTTLFVDLEKSGLTSKVVVTDNNSGDGLFEWIAEHFPQVETIQIGGNYGFARGVNPGMRALDARYYFVLNPDTQFVEPNTIRRLYDWMESNPKVGVSAPRLLNGDGTLQYSCHRFPTVLVQLIRRSPLSHRQFFKRRIDSFLLKDVDRTIARPVDWVQGSAMFIRRGALKQVGLLDEKFWMYFEDTDWCRRFWNAGWLIYYLPEISLVHHHGRGSAKVPGVIAPLFKNPLARAHLQSWARYFWKWRNERPLKLL
ncbi:MAG: glycosyltransferase family 2 protein [Candidatus Magasanikbacteria bacterium]|nr:glycosyltransferase family 2 protein [Candidatus Magasanikbacteria bacterium]